MTHCILIIDDEPAIRTSLRGLLEDDGFIVKDAETGEAGLELLAGDPEPGIDAVLLDVWLPKMDGIEVLKTIKKSTPSLPVIMLSGHASIETAVSATKNGAYHFVEKPFSADTLLLTLRHALKENHLERENIQLKTATGRSGHEILGKSEAFSKMFEQGERAAGSDAWVLIHGENGTGKESVAHFIHEKSPRADGPFVEVNCAAIPEELIESELFGHEKGSFTGASNKKIGKFDQANQGTLFLDEIADMSLKTQAKILRVLQEQRFERVGGSKTIEVNVRVIAASNKRLEDEIASGNFREDLFYRLNVLALEVPPLRERKGDVALLVAFFLDFFATNHNQKKKTLSPEALELLENYRWPGNIRELKNIVERIVIMVPDNMVNKKDIPPVIHQGFNTQNGLETPHENDPVFNLNMTYREAKDHFEKSFIKAQLENHKGNISRTAEAIKLERSNLHKKIKQLNIDAN